MERILIHEAINQIRFEVRNFKANPDGRSWNFSCEVCGDSSKDRRKARFGVAIKGDGAVVGCFNCGYANRFESYLKVFHPSVYERISVENIKNQAPTIFDYDTIIDKMDDEVVYHTMFMENFRDAKQWLTFLAQKNIKVSKKTAKRLYKVFRQTNGDTNATQK